ncbi:MAG: UTRA domain-containing protein [Pseudonocardiaceae bacterium]
MILATGTGAQVPVADSTIRRAADDVTRQVGTWLDLVAKTPLLREVNTGPGGMYSRMEEFGHRVHFEESVTCRLPYNEEREKLVIDMNQPVLVLWRRAYDQNNRILDLTHRIVVGDRHELVYRYDSTT